MTKRKHIPRPPEVRCACNLYGVRGWAFPDGHGADRCPLRERQIEGERLRNMSNLRRQLEALGDAEAAFVRADDALADMRHVIGMEEDGGAIEVYLPEVLEAVMKRLRADLEAEEAAQMQAMKS